MTLRSVLPASSMAIFVEDERQDLLRGYAHGRLRGGAHVPMLRQLKKARGGGIAGWAAVNRRGVLNADAALDLGLAASLARAALAQRGDRAADKRRSRRRRAVVLRRVRARLHRGPSPPVGTTGGEPGQRHRAPSTTATRRRCRSPSTPPGASARRTCSRWCGRTCTCTCTWTARDTPHSTSRVPSLARLTITCGSTRVRAA